MAEEQQRIRAYSVYWSWNPDIKILTPELQISNWRYGLGVGRPVHNMAARIRKR